MCIKSVVVHMQEDTNICILGAQAVIEMSLSKSHTSGTAICVLCLLACFVAIYHSF